MAPFLGVQCIFHDVSRLSTREPNSFGRSLAYPTPELRLGVGAPNLLVFVPRKYRTHSPVVPQEPVPTRALWKEVGPPTPVDTLGRPVAREPGCGKLLFSVSLDRRSKGRQEGIRNESQARIQANSGFSATAPSRIVNPFRALSALNHNHSSFRLASLRDDGTLLYSGPSCPVILPLSFPAPLISAATRDLEDIEIWGGPGPRLPAEIFTH